MGAYDLSAYGAMILDKSRDLYTESLVRRIKPGDRVLDLGSGTGYFALMALKQGAGKVYAVDNDPEALRWIEPCAWENRVQPGLLTAICKDINKVTLEDIDNEKVDVLVWDTRGTIPHDLTISSVIAARRYLKPEGVIISRKDSLYLALIEDSSYWGKLVSPWCEDGVRGIKMTSCLDGCLDRFYQYSFGEENLVSDPVLFKEIDYAKVEPDDGYLKGSTILTAKRKSILHGFALWFDSEIDDGLSMSNKPGIEDTTLYRQLFLPLREPCFVDEGYNVNLSLSLKIFEAPGGMAAQSVRNGFVADTDARLVMSFEQDG